ncbi:MAG: efflux RND transporter periplasmic adaptor subunit [Acidobacteriota bacterium]
MMYLSRLLFVALLSVSVSIAAEDAERGWIGVIVPVEAVDLAARTTGRIERIEVRAGDRVDTGALLVTLDTRNASQELRIAEADLDMAEAQLERAETRARQERSRLERRSDSPELWSEEELAALEVEAQAAEAEAGAERARVSRARATVEQLGQSLDELEIRAPFPGRVATRFLDPGAVVNAGTPIIRFVSSRASLVRFAVPPQELVALRLGDSVTVTESPSGATIGRATVRHIAPEIDLASQRVFVEALIEATTLTREPRGGLGVEVHGMVDR